MWWGSEVLATASIVFLGKQGFKAIKNKIFAFAKAIYTMMIYAGDAFAAAKSESPAAAVWGFDIAQQGDQVFNLFLIGELSFLVADWWGKFRRIFVWEAPAA